MDQKTNGVNGDAQANGSPQHYDLDAVIIGGELNSIIQRDIQRSRDYGTSTDLHSRMIQVDLLASIYYISSVKKASTQRS